MGRAGLITSLVVGIAALIIGVIVAFVIIENVATVEESLATSSGFTGTVINESGWLNSTPYYLGTADIVGFTNPTVITVYNQTENSNVESANWTLSDAGVFLNTSASTGFDSITISYTYDYKITSYTTEGMRANFTTGIKNVSDKLPVILLIAAVVIVLTMLALLWAQYKGMGIGGSGSGDPGL